MKDLMDYQGLVTKWVDAKTQLPKLGQWVDVVIDGVVQRQSAYLEEMSCMGEPSVMAWTFADEESDSAPLLKVSHWLPMREFPVAEVIAKHQVSKDWIKKAAADFLTKRPRHCEPMQKYCEFCSCDECVNDLAEVIARNVQPSPDGNPCVILHKINEA